MQTSTSGHEGVEEEPVAADAFADPKEPGSLKTSTSGHEGAEVTPATDGTKSSPPVRRSTREGAGQHSNPHLLPRPVVREGMMATAIDPQIGLSLLCS